MWGFNPDPLRYSCEDEKEALEWRQRHTEPLGYNLRFVRMKPFEVKMVRVLTCLLA